MGGYRRAEQLTALGLTLTTDAAGNTLARHILANDSIAISRQPLHCRERGQNDILPIATAPAILLIFIGTKVRNAR